MLQKKITRISLGISITLVAIMWVVFFFDYSFKLELYKYGLRPRSLEGLLGVFTAPFIHSTKDFTHIINNSIPTLVLTWMLFYFYRTIATKTFLFIYLFTGIATWALARDSYHIGMSGVIYGMTSFLVVSGFYRKNMRISGVSLAVIFLYGSMVWGIFPNEPNVSWEGHAFGLIGGLCMAYYFKQKGPQPTKMRYEIEEELGIEPDDYWKIPEDHKPKPAPKIIINYTIVPKEIKVESENSTSDDKKESE